MNDKKILKIEKIVRSYFKSIIGVFLIIVGIVVISNQTIYTAFDYTSQETYGGDAYTGIQNAAADTSNNISNLGSEIKQIYYNVTDITGTICIASGILTIAYNVLENDIKRREKVKA